VSREHTPTCSTAEAGESAAPWPLFGPWIVDRPAAVDKPAWKYRSNLQQANDLCALQRHGRNVGRPAIIPPPPPQAPWDPDKPPGCRANPHKKRRLADVCGTHDRPKIADQPLAGNTGRGVIADTLATILT